MDKDEKAFQSMLHALEMFFQDKVNIILRGQREVEEHIEKIPHTWRICLNSDLPIFDAVLEVWHGLEHISFDSLGLFAERVYDLGLVFSNSKKSIIGLCYIFRHENENGVFYKSWIGGLPATESDFQRFHKLTTKLLPISYRAFCQVHDGFLRNGNLSMGFMPIYELTLNQTWLAFYGDGAGNVQTYNLSDPIKIDEFMTYDWDHETREFSKPSSFWDFLSGFFLTEFGDRKYVSFENVKMDWKTLLSRNLDSDEEI